MKTFCFVAAVAALVVAVCGAPAPGGVHGAVVSGPAGVVTSHGAIGPGGHGLGGYGGYGGYGGLGGHGGAYLGGPVAGPALVAGPAVAPAAVIGPAVSHSSIVGPTGYGGHGLGLGLGGHGLGLGLGGYGGYAGLGGGYGGYGGHGLGLGLTHGVAVTNGGGTIGLSHHGVTVKGPATVPATIAGPAGKIVADGLYGVPSHGHW